MVQDAAAAGGPNLLGLVREPSADHLVASHSYKELSALFEGG